MALTKHEVNLLVGYMIALFHKNGWKIPAGLAPYSGTVGVVKRGMIRHVQTTYKLKVTGEFDTATQKFLTPVDPRQHKATLTIAYMHWCVTQHGRFVYSQERPSSNPRPSPETFLTIPRGGRYRDCSLNGKDGTAAGGFAQTDSFSYESGYGNTDSILAYAQAHGKIRPIAALRQADYVILSDPGHLITVVGPHATNPAGARLFASDGHQGAPEYVTLEREIATHGGPYYGIAVD